jgi:ATP-dependent exoDNAse (exonuclease V) alpha subunit
VHKAQGSEWRKVFFVIHRAFKVLLFRELIYTAMTRAREELVIIDTSNALEGAIASQRIKGNSIEEKIEWFNSKLALTEVVPIIP